MRSLVARYNAGEWVQVWDEIRHLEPVPPARQAEVEQVASVTMRKAAGQIRRIGDLLLAMGFEPANPGAPLIASPPSDVAVRIQQAQSLVGPLPAALRASMAEIGAVSLLGDLPALRLYYQHTPTSRISTMPPGPEYPDPLYLPGIDLLEWEIAELESDTRQLREWNFPFAPDELHKANISGGTHDLRLPDGCADPKLWGVAGRQGIRLVEYLRLSVSWGGFPGYTFDASACPPALEHLRAPAQF